MLSKRLTISSFLLISTLLIVGLHAIAAGNESEESESNPIDQFDFWVGEWELTWPGGQAGTPPDQKGVGYNTIRRVLSDKVIEENFRTADESYLGRSWSVYNSTKNQWQQNLGR